MHVHNTYTLVIKLNPRKMFLKVNIFSHEQCAEKVYTCETGTNLIRMLEKKSNFPIGIENIAVFFHAQGYN